MKSFKKFKQGLYKPKHPGKYMGKLAQYRSGYELKFFEFCDNNPRIIKWGSENVIIPYISPVDNRLHRYFVDNIVHVREGNITVKYLVEIKPSTQTVAPQISKNKKNSTLLYEQVTYSVNQAKWKAAEEYCKQQGYQWAILTEKELGI